MSVPSSEKLLPTTTTTNTTNSNIVDTTDVVGEDIVASFEVTNLLQVPLTMSTSMPLSEELLPTTTTSNNIIDTNVVGKDVKVSIEVPKSISNKNVTQQKRIAKKKGIKVPGSICNKNVKQQKRITKKKGAVCESKSIEGGKRKHW